MVCFTEFGKITLNNNALDDNNYFESMNMSKMPEEYTLGISRMLIIEAQSSHITAQAPLDIFSYLDEGVPCTNHSICIPLFGAPSSIHQKYSKLLPPNISKIS